MIWNEITGNARFRQYWAAITVNMGMMSGGEFFGWPSPTLPKLEQPDSPLHLDHFDISWMVSFLYLGNVISPIPTGYFMDRFGRKRSLLYGSVFPISSWLLVLVASHPAHLHLARLLGGLWLGTVTTIAPMYTGEIAEPAIRGALGNVFSMMTYLGTLVVYAVGPYVSYHTLAVVAGMTHVYFLIAMFSVPESPYYYLINNDKQNAKQALRWLRAGVEEDKLEIEINAMEETVKKQMENKRSLKAILESRANRKAFFIVQMYAIFTKFAGLGIIMAFTSITLPKSAFKSLTPSDCAIFLATTWVISSFLSIVLVDRLGRRFLLSSTSFGCSITLFIAGLWFFMDSKTCIDVEHLSWVPFTCFVLHGLVYSLGMGPIGTAIKGELLSADIRASVSAITTITFAFSSIFLNQTYLPVADHIGMYANYWLYSASSLVCAIFSMFILIETKGRTLQEIQEDLGAKKGFKHSFKLQVQDQNRTNQQAQDKYIETNLEFKH